MNQQVLTSSKRIFSVDMLRGLVMIVMALDHIRDYTTFYHFDPTDLDQTTVPLFFTRWVTHFCAPVFIFLAGVGAGLGEINGKSKKQLAHFLWTRGLWLILLEFTVVKLAWTFNFTDKTIYFLVIWVLGICMIALAAFIRLPKRWLLVFGLITVFGHNLLDSINPDTLGFFEPLWMLLHVKGEFMIGDFTAYVYYPFIPWVGVMVLGYVFADIYRLNAANRQRNLLIIGLVISILFVALRGANIYGDMKPWSIQPTFAMTLVSFFNVTKYPPSLAYLLMTLGPSIILLAIFERMQGSISHFLIVFGRVPMFFYILHLYLIHSLSVVIGYLQGYTFTDVANDFEAFPQGYGMGLVGTYVLWSALIIFSYFLCKAYIKFKKGRTHPFYSYI